MTTLEQQLNDAARTFYSALSNMIGENDTTIDIELMIEQIDSKVQQIIDGE